jgi:hypothetical protein
MLAGLLWFALLAAAMLFYTHSATLGATSGVFCTGLGIWYLVKYRDAMVRAKHIEYWTAKA